MGQERDMMKATLLRIAACFCCLALAVPAVAVPPPGISEAAPLADAGEVWLLPGQAQPARRVQVNVARPSTPQHAVDEAIARFSSTVPVPLVCEIESSGRFADAALNLEVLDAAGALQARDTLGMTLQLGLNTATFHLDLQALPPGDYTAMISVVYTERDTPARYVQPLRKTSATHLGERHVALRHALEDLESRIQQLHAEGAGAPYLRVRLNIAWDTLARAEALARAETWREMDYLLAYVEEAVTTLSAGLVFASLSPELLTPLPEQDLSQVQTLDGGFFAGHRPVFLLGKVLDSARPEEITALKRYGLNLAVLDMPPPPPGAPLPGSAQLRQQYDSLFDAARAANVSLSVQAAPPASGEALPAGWPRVPEMPFLDLPHPTARERMADYLQVLLPYLAEKPMLHGISLANEPQFKFRGEEVRERFLDWVQDMYGDRHDLNQAWRSHLRDFDDIQLWAMEQRTAGEGPTLMEPIAGDAFQGRRGRRGRDRGAVTYDRESQYQERRAYQYDWQMFHRGLSTEYFAWLASQARRAAPRVPLMVTTSGTAFEPGETRHGIEREPLAQIFDINATTLDQSPVDRFFAFAYPRQSAVYSHLRTLAPGKPVFNMKDDFEFELLGRPALHRPYLHAAVWEAAMSGLNATAIAADSAIFKDPHALEGLATATLDINRLGELVHAFQQAPPDIGILFSESAKIFDDGLPHLQSAVFAYEGCSFAGYHVRFITEAQIAAGVLDHIRILVLPDTPAVSDHTFERLQEYVENGGTVARSGTPIPYNEHGHSRTAVLRNTEHTVLVRGLNLPTEFLHAMDAAMILGALPPITRPINAHGYPLEGVRTRYLEIGGVPHLYLLNLRKEPVISHLTGNIRQGRDLIHGRDVSFPTYIRPLEPMLIRLDRSVHEKTVVAGAGH